MIKKGKKHTEYVGKKEKWRGEKWRKHNDKILCRNIGNFINMPRIHVISGCHHEVTDNVVCTKNLTKEHQPRNVHLLNMTRQFLPGGGGGGGGGWAMVWQNENFNGKLSVTGPKTHKFIQNKGV
jgi:hypothetical protein